MFFGEQEPRLSLKEEIRFSYGAPTLDLFKGFNRCKERVGRFQNHILFNTRSKKENVLPKSLHVRPLVNTTNGHRIADRAANS